MSSEQKIAAAETEVEMITDMFNRFVRPYHVNIWQLYIARHSCFPHLTQLCPRLSESCSKKCIPNDYREGDLNKGESVCLDRCVGKFFEVNIKVSEKMQGVAGQQQGGAGLSL